MTVKGRQPQSGVAVVFAVLAALLVLPLALATRAEAFIYWTNGPTPPCDNEGFCSGPVAIGRANLDGTGVIQRFIEGDRGANLDDVAVDAEHIYWTRLGAIGRANLDGTKIDPNFITTPGSLPGGVSIAVDADHVYWTEQNGIGRASLDGTGVDADFITIAHPAGDPLGGSPLRIAVDAEHIYWTPYPTFPYDILAIGRANLDGTGVNQSFIIRGPPCSGPVGQPCNGLLGDIVVDASHIYWTEGGGVARANLDGSAVDPAFIDGVGSALAMDAAHFYAHFYLGRAGTSSPAALGGGSSHTPGPRVPLPPPPAWLNRADISGTVDSGFRIDIFSPTRGIAVNFSVGKAKKANDRGIAKLKVEAPAPGTLALAQNKKVKDAEVRADAAGWLQLPVMTRGPARKQLAEKGRAKVKVEITYTPDGGEPETQVATLRLKR